MSPARYRFNGMVRNLADPLLARVSPRYDDSLVMAWLCLWGIIPACLLVLPVWLVTEAMRHIRTDREGARRES